ncbi:hypothetical protein [Mycolicibacterium mageritense]|uniref:DUF732 domain-containing protein n=1 Tax=Mycolicibacterium mageritense TaxID=53462 RepID=A0AAI8U2F2_MYCME|nr:hypothetical protein [Mycolicibacterium mageritense]BDY33203.1 hypothetical protein hbim_07178 [Mycolicibacterium mageritense]
MIRRTVHKRTARRRIIGTLSAAVLIGTGAGYIATPAARADGVLSDTESAYVLAYASTAVCPTIAEYPSKAGVLGVAQAIMDDGFAADSAVDIINASVQDYCPKYWPLLQRIGAQARGEQAA